MRQTCDIAADKTRRLERRGRSLARRLKRLARQFGKNRSAATAVEFALVLPVLLLMYTGTVELTNAVSANRKVAATASTVGDLAAQSTTIDNTTMASIFSASTAVMQPFTSTNLSLRVTQIAIDANGNPTVSWSDASSGSALPALTPGNAFSGLPATLASPSSYLIYAEARYGYTSPIGELIVGTLTMNNSFYLRARIGTCVKRNNAC